MKGGMTMARIAIGDLKAGMVLAEPVQAQGRVLLSAGALVGEKHLRIFKTWGVREVVIEKAASDRAGHRKAPPDADEVRRIQRLIDERFAKCDAGHELARELKSAALRVGINRLIDK
jgi:hypothetical protein